MQGRKILVGVCGSIAAYKIAILVRLLVKRGHEVRVIMTESAKSFIPPLTLATLSKNPVLSDFVKNDQGEWENHVDLGAWADLFVIAPLSANTLSKLVSGACDNLLTAVYLSAKCPVMVAPAMDLDMYRHPTTLTNISRLKEHGVQILEAEFGELASGLVGQGRMSEPEQIDESIESFFSLKDRFAGKNILITAGPTHEKLDPVRFIGNNSSGKMGIALAESLANQGAAVKLISGPGVSRPNNPNISVQSVTSAEQMFEASKQYYADMDVAIFAAAVADYRPEQVADQKIKKSEDSLTIALVKNPDIAKELGQMKRDDQFNIGFALETNDEYQNAQGKMVRKNLDMIVLNSLNDEGAGFSVDTNKITIFSPNDEPLEFPMKSKQEVAADIVNLLYDKIS